MSIASMRSMPSGFISIVANGELTGREQPPPLSELWAMERAAAAAEKQRCRQKNGAKNPVSHRGPTTQTQRPRARDATMATATLPPGSLQRRVVRPRKIKLRIHILSVCS
jgi:hypothetical protein